MFTTLSVHQTTLLIGSIAVLGLAPLVYRVVRRTAWARAMLEGFVLLSVGGLVVVHILPEAIRLAGWWALVGVLTGIGLPLVLERIEGLAARRTHGLALAVSLVGLAAHASLDGMALALAPSAGHRAAALGLAIVAHRLPMGLFIWSRTQPGWGQRSAIAVLGGIALATVAGFGLGSGVGSSVDGWVFGLFLALVAGTLIHVLIHRPNMPEESATRHAPVPETLGAAVGLLLVVGLDLATAGTHVEHPEVATYADTVLELALSVAPALLVGYLVAGLLAPQGRRSLVPWRRGWPLVQAARGVLYGMPMPVCSCGVAPAYRRLLARGAPQTAALAFLVATPELGLETLLLSVPLLGPGLTVARMVAAALVALLVGWWIGRLASPASTAVRHPDEPAPARGLAARFRRALRVGLVDLVDDTGAWILFGLAVAAAIGPGAMSELLAGLPDGLDVVLFSLVGLPFYVCAVGATPIVAALVVAGASPGAGIALLVAGPAVNLTTLRVLAERHGRGFSLLYAACVCVLTAGAGVLVNRVIGLEPLPLASAGARLGPAWLHALSLGVLVAALTASVLRNGPSSTVRSVLEVAEHEHHDHSHHHAHHHAQ